MGKIYFSSVEKLKYIEELKKDDFCSSLNDVNISEEDYNYISKKILYGIILIYIIFNTC